jgi:hypothetical protein
MQNRCLYAASRRCCSALARYNNVIEYAISIVVELLVFVGDRRMEGLVRNRVHVISKYFKMPRAIGMHHKIGLVSL